MTNTNIEFGDALTWDEVAKIYQNKYGGVARTLPIGTVFDRVAKLSFIYLHPDGTLHIIKKQEERKK